METEKRQRGNSFATIDKQYIYRISPAIFFTLAIRICFCLPFLKYGLPLAIGSPLFRALL
jgi:hypothetical protein